MANAHGNGRIPTFGVRFESADDFLIEYTDHLRHGYFVLPLVGEVGVGSPVRIKLQLPSAEVLYLTGSAVPAGPAHGDIDSVDGTLVKLAPLTEEQVEQVQGCVEGVIGPSDQDPEKTKEDGPLSVLLVDDSVSVRIELGDAMRARGMRVRVSDNGLVALSTALKRPPDVVLTDVDMPVMDGWTFLRMARSRKRLAGLPIVFFTRLSDELSRLKGYRMGVDDYLPKSMPADEIVARLRGVIARRLQGGEALMASQGLRGDIEHVRLGSVLAFIESERRTGELHLASGDDTAVLHVCRGQLESVENLGRFGRVEDRVFELLGWTRGTFEFVNAESNREPAPDSRPLTYLLMEHARRLDEANAP